MPYLVRYTIDDAAWRALSERVRARAADLRPVLREAGEYMLLEVDDRFRHERDPQGKPWKALAASTLRQKKGRKILQESGTRGGLRGSITYRAYRTALEHGTGIAYAAVHQLGGQAGRGRRVTIPARPYLGYSEENISSIREMVRRYLEGA